MKIENVVYAERLLMNLATPAERAVILGGSVKMLHRMKPIEYNSQHQFTLVPYGV